MGTRGLSTIFLKRLTIRLKVLLFMERGTRQNVPRILKENITQAFYGPFRRGFHENLLPIYG